MSEKLFIQFQETGTEAVLWFHVDDEQIQKSGSLPVTELGELTAEFPVTPIIVLVPSRDCLVTRVALPTRQRRQQLKAIPFALEEQLADEIETMHFAIGKRDDKGLLPVIAVARNKMQNWLDLLADAGLSATAMLPASALLEAPEDAWSIFQLGELFLINQGGNCWGASADAAALMLQLSIQAMDDEALPGLLYWGDEEIPAWVAGLGLEYSIQSLKDPQQALLARFNLQQINLLQGDFEVQDDWNAGWKVWRRVAVLALAVVLLKFTMMGFDLYRLSDEQQYLKKEITRTYHQVAPGARIVNPEQQMRQLLKQRSGGQNQSGSFLVMLSQVGEGLAVISDIQPTNLNYDSNRGEIRLDLLVSRLPVFDQLKEQLTKQGLSVEVGGASAQGSRYSGRLIIRSGS